MGYGPPLGYGFAPRPPGPLGVPRSTGICVLLYFATLSIYGFVWFYKVHEEMKRHSHDGIGGGIALLLLFLTPLTFISGLVAPFLTSAEVGKLYERRGAPAPVSGATGLWFFPGLLLVVLPVIWFVQTNNALNEYWTRSAQAVPPPPA